MKRTLIAITLGLGLASVAFADNNNVRADANGKRTDVAGSQADTQSPQQSGKYDIVDRYNP
jgi:hypothetical protein